MLSSPNFVPVRLFVLLLFDGDPIRPNSTLVICCLRLDKEGMGVVKWAVKDW
jgi:hypothetical protein